MKELREVIRKVNLGELLYKNGVDLTKEDVEELEVCIDGDCKELLDMFGNDIDIIKEKRSEHIEKCISSIIIGLYENTTKSHFDNCELKYDNYGSVVNV